MGSPAESLQRIKELEGRVRWTRKAMMAIGMVLISTVAMNTTTIAANNLLENTLAHYGFRIQSYSILVHTRTIPPANGTLVTFNVTVFDDSGATARNLWLNFTAIGPNGVTFKLDGVSNDTQTVNKGAEWIISGPFTIRPNQELAFVHTLSWSSTADFGDLGSYDVFAGTTQQP